MSRKSLFLFLFLLTGALMLAIAARPGTAGDFSATQYDRWVVRAGFSDPAMVAELAAWKEPWSVDYNKSFLVVDVNQVEYNWLVDAGFSVEIDPELTAEINRPRRPLPDQGGGIPGYPCYRTVEETFATAEALVASYPQFASWIDAGDSWEKTSAGGLPGYDMMVLRLTNSAIAGPKPSFFATSAIHAREYTTAELMTRFAEYLLNNYGTDADATWLLDYHEIHLMLHTNPDGRKQAETGILWRKNTNNNYCSNTNDRGADLNRNFDFQWGCCGGSSGSQCSETYRGPSAGSEPETQAVQEYMRLIFPDQRDDPLDDPAPEDATGVYIDIHSYSELVLWPWGFTGNPPPNSTDLQTLGRRLAYFNGYFPEQAIGLYPTDGTTDDFAYGDLGVAGYTFELGTAFFQGCSTFENTILPDNLPALIYAAKSARTPYMTPSGPEAINLALDNSAPLPGTSVELTAVVDDTRSNNTNGVEPSQNITAVEYYVDLPPWDGGTPLPMTASDGNFNSTSEAVEATIDTTGFSAGRHILYVRGQDASNSWGPVTAIFLYTIDPAVSPIIEGFVRDVGSNAPLAAEITIGNQFQTTTDPGTGFYQTQVISGTYDITASADNYASQTVTDVALFDFQTVQQDFALTPICAAFDDDVESGNIGWTAQSPWAITTEASHSPTHSWTDSPGGDYGNNANTSLTSPVIDLSDFTGVTLNYWQICDTESGYDFCYVEVSDDGGTTWTTVTSFDGSGSTWEEISLAVPQLDNQPDARIRFRLDTDFTVTEDGWHVDDIRLMGAGPACSSGVAPTAGFSSNSPVMDGDPVEFTNTSTGTDLTFEWDFGDGSPISNETDPSHLYGGPGIYTVILTATNDLGSDSFSDDVEVLESGIAPTAGFSSNSPVMDGEPVEFTNTSTGTDLTFEWDFGDGSPISNETDPSHLYAGPGVYTVILTASNGLGSDSFSDDVEVLETGIAPTAGFSSNSPVMDGEPVEFTNTSTGTSLTYEWDFGDGSPISNAVNPDHTYPAPGVYTVILTATNNLGSDSFSDDVEVLEAGIAPTAFFTASAVIADVGELIQFTNLSEGTDLTFEWDFGDGSPVSNETDPSHAFDAPGVYQVTLTASNDLGGDSYTLEIEVVEPPEPVMNYYYPLIFRQE